MGQPQQFGQPQQQFGPGAPQPYGQPPNFGPRS
jgi:hypothetical protein